MRRTCAGVLLALAAAGCGGGQSPGPPPPPVPPTGAASSATPAVGTTTEDPAVSARRAQDRAMCTTVLGEIERAADDAAKIRDPAAEGLIFIRTSALVRDYSRAAGTGAIRLAGLRLAEAVKAAGQTLSAGRIPGAGYIRAQQDFQDACAKAQLPAGS
jgi:hypothetical protein